MARNGETRGRIRLAAAAFTLPLAALALGGCDLGGAEPDAMQTGGLSYEQSTKLSQYARVLIDFDPRRLKREFEERDIAGATPSDSPFVDALGVSNPSEDLRRVRAMDGKLDDIDPLVDRLLEPLQRLSSRAGGLQSYLTMRGYLADDFARARQEAPAMIADYDAVIAATEALQAKVSAASLAVENDLLQRLKTEGRMADVHDLEIAREVRALRKAVPDTGPVDEAGLASMETIINRLIPLLDKARAARADEKNKAGEDAPLDNGVIASAEALVGAYREYRRSQDDDDLQRVRESASGVLRLMG